jgi:hypothetical protein
MKKQLLIAAIAATMSVSAMADMSITGSANVKMKAAELSTGGTTESSSMNMDIDFAAKNGGTAVYAHLDFDDAGEVSNDASTASTGSLTIDKLWMTTSIGSVNVKAGDYSSCTGSIEAVKACVTTNNKIGLSTNVGDFTVGYTKDMNDSSAADTIALSGTVAGFAFKVKDSEDTYTNISVKGDLPVGTGTGFYLENHNADAADSDTTVFAAHTKIGGATVSFASLDADETGATGNSGDVRLLGSSLIGDYHTAAYGTVSTMTDVKAAGVNFDMAGNNVNIVTGSADTNGAVDDRDFTDIVIQRKLVSGATLDVSYGVADTGTAGVDTTNYGAILNVKF